MYLYMALLEDDGYQKERQFRQLSLCTEMIIPGSALDTVVHEEPQAVDLSHVMACPDMTRNSPVL